MVKKDIMNCNSPEGAIIIWDLPKTQKRGENSKPDYNISYVVLKAQETTIKYKFQNEMVIYYVLEGNGLIHINGDEEKLYPVQILSIPPHSPHYIENNGEVELKFIRVVYSLENKK